MNFELCVLVEEHHENAETRLHLVLRCVLGKRIISGQRKIQCKWPPRLIVMRSLKLLAQVVRDTFDHILFCSVNANVSSFVPNNNITGKYAIMQHVVVVLVREWPCSKQKKLSKECENFSVEEKSGDH